ncbi:MAG: hypothetical protein KF902_05645 [Phycisphaeraceae bacterium]|nr:hypothetical protein [Phycisphaeraceae bacterium]
MLNAAAFLSSTLLAITLSTGTLTSTQPVPAQQPPKEPATVTSIPAAIDDATFLAGDWSAVRTGERGGKEFVQEVWTAPAGNNMMGMFRWLNASGKPIVFEILTIVEEGGTLTLRLRHQTATGIAWEEKDKPATFTLAAKSATRLNFVDSAETNDLSACIYECPTPDTLVITVKFDNPEQKDLVFRLSRSTP